MVRHGGWRREGGGLFPHVASVPTITYRGFRLHGRRQPQDLEKNSLLPLVPIKRIPDQYTMVLYSETAHSCVICHSSSIMLGTTQCGGLCFVRLLCAEFPGPVPVRVPGTRTSTRTSIPRITLSSLPRRTAYIFVPRYIPVEIFASTEVL